MHNSSAKVDKSRSGIAENERKNGKWAVGRGPGER